MAQLVYGLCFFFSLALEISKQRSIIDLVCLFVCFWYVREMCFIRRNLSSCIRFNKINPRNELSQQNQKVLFRMKIGMVTQHDNSIQKSFWELINSILFVLFSFWQILFVLDERVRVGVQIKHCEP